MIKVTNLNKYYNKGKVNELHVINNTNLELPDKGLISLLGPSGSGKTTLLSVIGGLDSAKGTIQYDDKVIKNYSVSKIDKYRKEHIGYIFQNYNLLLNESVYNNLVISLELIGIIDKEEVKKRIEYTLKAVGMYKYRKKKAYALSGGQQQRVAIARALIKNSKIIIADEPTGNLDTENTIEVMKILKEISKSTLVLLVTHDMNVANLYSDRIIKIKDGVIVEEYDNDIKSGTVYGNGNTIYLKDLNCDEKSTKVGNLKIYHDEHEQPQVNISIVVRNGNYYLQSDKPIKLIENSNLKLVNDHKSSVENKPEEKIEYDTTWFKKENKGFKHFICVMFKMIKDGFMNLRKVNKKGKLIYLCLLFMGMLVALSIVCLINFSYVDKTHFVYADNTYQLTSLDHTFSQDPLINIVENYKSGNIENVGIYQPKTKLILKHRLTMQKGINVELDTMVGHYNSVENNKILYGRTPVDKNEIVIDTVMAKNIVKQYGNRSKIQDALDKKVTLNNKSLLAEVTIVGIIDGSQKAVFGTEEFYVNWCSPTTANIFGHFRYDKAEVDKNGTPLYEIVSGSALTETDSPNHVLIPENSEYLGLPFFAIGESVYYIKGVYRYKDNCIPLENDVYITNTPPELLMTQLYNGACKNIEDYMIIDGREPQAIDECIVSVYLTVYSQYQIGKVFTNTDGNSYKIVGVYNGSTKAVSTKFIQTKESYIFTHYTAEEISFTLKNTKNIITADKEVMLDLYTINMNKKEENREINVILYELLFFVLIFICSVFVYFVMRSRLITMVYDVGVKRSIGASKAKILGQFLIDDLIITTLFSLV